MVTEIARDAIEDRTVYGGVVATAQGPKPFRRSWSLRF
jgi:hypothetical protein